MKKILLILSIFVSTLLFFTLEKIDNNFETVAKTDNDFKTVLIQLQENYDTLTTESCGEAYYLYEGRLKKNNIKYRALSIFADPFQSYETHVAVEVWDNGDWIFIDPTFNGYYSSSKSKKPLSAFDIRKAVKENRLDDIQWIQNGKAKAKYDIAKYYINPLYLFKGLMYVYNNKSYYITDEWIRPFNHNESIFNERGPVIPITHPAEIESIPSYGIDRGYKTILIKDWDQYQTIKTTEVNNLVNIKTDAGGIVSTIKVEKGKYYAFEVPVIINKGVLTISVQSHMINMYDGISENKSYRSKVFESKSEELKIYLYSDSNIDFTFDKTKIKLIEIINDFSSQIDIVCTP